MNPSRFLVLLPRLRAVAALAVLLAAPCALAAKKVVADVTAEFSFMVYYGENSSFALDNQRYLYDDDLTTAANVNDNNRYFIASASFTDTEPAMYVDKIRFDLPDTSTLRYSLYVSTNYDVTAAQSAVWSPVASNIETTESASFEIKNRIKAIKFVFENGSPQTALAEFHVTGFRSSIPKVVSSYAIASFHNANGTIETADFGGGDNWGANAGRRLFDNNFETYWPQPRAQVGSFIMIDFTKNDGNSALREYYVTKVLVGSNGTQPFTLQYSDTGTNNWENVIGAVSVKYDGTGTFEVGANAKYVRYVFNGVNWGYAMSQGYLAEIQVWGMNPDDVPCTHPGFTEWEVSIPASCTDRAQLSRFCTECGEEFTMKSSDLPLGHDYVTTLMRSGKYRKPGSGTITCSRCNFLLDFPEPIDLVTSRVDNVLICGRKTEGIVRFVDYDVSSENHPQWGPAALHLVDNAWNGEGSYPYWFSDGVDNQYADFMFGTNIDLTAVEFSVFNHGYLFQFYDLDVDTGEETLVGEQEVVKDNTVVGTKLVKQKTVDPETGEETEVEIEVEVVANYQRIWVPFYETTVKNLRIRITDYEPTVNGGWNQGNGDAGIAVLEIHPWGTVVGAGELRYRKETLIIFR